MNSVQTPRPTRQSDMPATGPFSGWSDEDFADFADYEAELEADHARTSAAYRERIAEAAAELEANAELHATCDNGDEFPW